MAIDKSKLAKGRVITGFSHPVIAKYNAPGGPGSYTDGMVAARGVSVDLDINTADDNNFYADNAVAETEAGIFTDGTMTLGLDGMHPDVERFVLGLDEPRTVEVGGQSIQLAGTGTGANPPYVGVGFVIEYKSGGQNIYVPAYVTKAKFRQGGFSARTRGESIDWQSVEATVDLHRDDTENRYWKEIGPDCASENEATALLHALLAVEG